MRAESYKLAVLVMRAQGMHDGHGHILEQLEGEFDGTLILVGSSYRPRSWKNPFTFAERRSFIAAGTRHIDMNIDAMPLLDTLYNDRAWASNVRAAVRFHMRHKGLDPETTEIVMTGFEKDKSSEYQNWFPEWGRKPIEPFIRDGHLLNATDLRQALFFPGGRRHGCGRHTLWQGKGSYNPGLDGS